MKLSTLNDAQFGLLFDVRRSIRYHDRRRAFFERLHQITGGLTVLLAGSVLFDLARPGDTPAWLSVLAVTAALLSAWDIVAGYASKATLHRDLKCRFVDLEIAIFSADMAETTWIAHRLKRLAIERDEPPIYRALDTLCHNDLMVAEGFDRKAAENHFAKLNAWQRITRHIFHWANLTSS